MDEIATKPMVSRNDVIFATLNYIIPIFNGLCYTFLSPAIYEYLGKKANVFGALWRKIRLFEVFIFAIILSKVGSGVSSSLRHRR